VGSSIGGVIVSVLTLSVVDHGFEHRWCNSKRADFECRLHHRCSNPRSTTLKVSTLTITPSMLEPTIYYTQSQHAYYYTTDARTHDLPSIDGVIVTVLTLSVVDRGFEHRWCNSKRADFECSRSWVRASLTHDLLHSKSARLLLHHRCSNPRSTTLKVSTLTITPSIIRRIRSLCLFCMFCFDKSYLLRKPILCMNLNEYLLLN
jgi:hypothetical protein